MKWRCLRLFLIILAGLALMLTLRTLHAAPIGFMQQSPYAGNLIGWWPLNEGGGNISQDYSGAGHNGTNTAYLGFTNGVIGNAVTLKNVSTNWSAVVIPAIFTNSTFTVSAWVNPSVMVSNSNYKIFDSSGVVNNGWSLTLRDNQIGWERNGIYNWISGTVVPTNQWSMITMTVDTTAVARLFLNDARSGGTISSFTFNPSDRAYSAIGNAAHPAEQLTGAIDSVRIYNRQLTAKEVILLYNKGYGTALP